MPPPASTQPSNIRAFVRWKDSSVYAGEDIECIITLKNVAPAAGQDEKHGKALQATEHNGTLRGRRQSIAASAGIHSRRSSVVQGRPSASRASSTTGPAAGGAAAGHRPTLSLNVISAPSRMGLQGAGLPAKAPNSATITGHARSLSIMSLGSETPSEGRTPTTTAPTKRPLRTHNRSASLQYNSKPMVNSSPSTLLPSPRQRSPLLESTTPSALPEGNGGQLNVRPIRKKSGTVSAGNTPQLGRQNSLQRRAPPGTIDRSFRFPATQPLAGKSPSLGLDRPALSRSPSTMHSAQNRAHSPRPPDGWTGALSNLDPITRVMSETSASGTPRTSSEFFSMSNPSDETLTSEVQFPGQPNGRLLPKVAHARQPSVVTSSLPAPVEPETLMMGYAQTMGYFVLDGSLINAAPFEEVKRKGVQGGGGVIGIEKPQRSSGMFGAFSWGNIGESLGGLLGSDEMSSMAQMKANAGSKSIPLLSTPQNLLFVDLQLAPGESRCYSYRFSLPRGLPPTHRGRAMKVSYHLALGVQRPGGRAVKQVEIPFRVLGSYNARGEMLGHDLMSPYTLLTDAARSLSIPHPSDSVGSPHPQFPTAVHDSKTPKQGFEDFLRYTERLLSQPTDSGAAASPSSPTSRSGSFADHTPTAIKDTIDFAIMRANIVNLPGSDARASDRPSANRFNIARAGQPVAVLTLLRPLYRLGETVIGTVDLTAPPPSFHHSAQIPTYSITIELESSERVDPSLALRSASSIHRVTRKLHASVRENTLFARRVGFQLAVPATATPTFESTGVSLEWRLRVEFTTQRSQAQGLGLVGGMLGRDSGDGTLLEELGSDERGTTLIAREGLSAETFEIAVPLKVYGVVGVEDLAKEVDAVEI